MADSKNEHSKITSTSPAESMRSYISQYLTARNLPEELISEVPKKWEKYGDFVLFDSKTFTSEVWKKQSDLLWMGLCEILKCKRIAFKSRIQTDGFRTPKVTMVIGDNPWVMYTDNKVKYTWNIYKNMFSAGNAPERHRIAKLDCKNQVVVDLYAGIGYFTLPYLVHSKAAYVHACEWNQDAVIALKQNLSLNKVEDKCSVYECDNKLADLKNLADRVNLGLLPSSEAGWEVACKALKPTGGVLHVHGNVESKNLNITCTECEKLMSSIELQNKSILIDSRTQEISFGEVDCFWKRNQWFTWAVHVLHSLVSLLLLKDPSSYWNCYSTNVHFVKSYAPHVDHLVLDVNVQVVS